MHQSPERDILDVEDSYQIFDHLDVHGLQVDAQQDPHLIQDLGLPFALCLILTLGLPLGLIDDVVQVLVQSNDQFLLQRIDLPVLDEQLFLRFLVDYYYAVLDELLEDLNVADIVGL